MLTLILPLAVYFVFCLALMGFSAWRGTDGMPVRTGLGGNNLNAQSETTQLHVKQPADLMEQVKEFRLNQRWNLQVAIEELLRAGLKAYADKKD